MATGSTVQYLSDVCKGDAMLIRRANSAGHHDITRSLEVRMTDNKSSSRLFVCHGIAEPLDGVAELPDTNTSL